MNRLLILLVILLFAGNAMAANWPPVDPKEYTTSTDFTLAWAKRLRDFYTLTDLQRAAGSKGTISSCSLDDDDPVVEFHWRSEPASKDNVGYMLATVRPNGKIGVSIITTNNERITLNTEGAFICDDCKPPISVMPIGSDTLQMPQAK